MNNYSSNFYTSSLNFVHPFVPKIVSNSDDINKPVTRPEKIQSTNSHTIPSINIKAFHCSQFHRELHVERFFFFFFFFNHVEPHGLRPRRGSSSTTTSRSHDRRLKDGSLFSWRACPFQQVRSFSCSRTLSLSLDEVNRYLTQFSSRAFKRANTENNGDFHVISAYSDDSTSAV